MAGGPKMELEDSRGRPVGQKVVTNEQIYAALEKKFSEQVRAISSLPPEEFIAKYMELARKFVTIAENTFRQYSQKYEGVEVPTDKRAMMERILAKADERFMAEFFVNNIEPALTEFEKIARRTMGSSKAEAMLAKINEYRGKLLEKDWTFESLGSKLVKDKVVTKEQFAAIVTELKAQGLLDKVEFAVASLQYVPRSEASSSFKESARKGIGKMSEARIPEIRKAIVDFVLTPVNLIRDAEFRADFAKRMYDYWYADATFTRYLKAAFGTAAVLGVIFIIGKCSGCGETPKGQRASTPVVVKEATPIPGIDKALQVEKGVGRNRRMEAIFSGRDGEEYARQITSKVKGLLPNEQEQQRAFAMVRSIVNMNEDLARHPETVLALVGAIVELQKAKRPVDELAQVAYKILQYYQPSAFVNVAKDLAAYSGKKGADLLQAVSEPDKFFPNKYTKQMTAEWSQRPFEIFAEMGFDVEKPFVKSASALIRQYFRREDWEGVAEAMAEFYKNRENEASKVLPKPGQKPQVPSSHELHLALLSMLMYSSTTPGQNVEGRSKGLSLEVAMDALRLFAKNVNPATQWSGDEAGQRRTVPIWQLAATQLIALNPTRETLDEKLGMVLSANPSWRLAGSTLGKGKDTSALIASLVGTGSKVKLNEKQQEAFTDALTALFAPDRQLEAANAIIPTISNSMSEAQLAEAVNGYGFEAKAAWRTESWKTYMDTELSDYFPKDSKGRGPKEQAQVASLLHGLATHEQYLAAREALIKFADKYEEKNGMEASPKVLLEAAESIVGMVREAKGEFDTEKMSDKALAPEKKKRR